MGHCQPKRRANDQRIFVLDFLFFCDLPDSNGPHGETFF
jgi:hypothetical protein